MTDVCRNCGYKDRCEELGYELDCQNEGECSVYDSFLEEDDA